MNLSNPLLLLIFCLFYFGITFILMSYLVSRRIKKNPLVLPQNDTPYGIVGKYFKLVIILLFTYVVMINITPSISIYYPDFSLMKSNTMVFIGFSVMFISLTLTIVSQITMSNSWRIGIDLDKKTELITIGIFNYSRNPIFLGMVLFMSGIFLVTPNILILMIVLLGFILIEFQVRLEEEFLEKQFGEEYIKYKKEVRRYI
jgi:protein-S-isoprenylcysteine O-methyltransferase Ste14